jgi:putative ABC transport system permease protein
MFRTTIKGLLAHRVRLITTMLSIILGVALMAGTLVLTDTVGATFDGLYADLNRGTDVVVRSAAAVGPPGQGSTQRGPVPAALVDTIRAVDGVAAVDGSVQGYAQFVGRDGKVIGTANEGAPALGLNWATGGVPNPFNLVDGREPRDHSEVAMDRGTADKGGFAVGDRVRLLTRSAPQDLTVTGIVRFGQVDSPLGASVALLDTATAQELVGTPGHFDRIAVAADRGVGQDELAAAVQRALPAEAEAVTGAAVTAEQQSSLRQNLSFFTTFLLVFALVALFVGSFIISNTFSIIVAQRVRELALLRALGAGRRQVQRAVLTEAAIVGTVASIVGVGVGVVMASGLRLLLGAVGFAIPATGAVVTGGTIAVTLLAGITVTLVSAWFPARRAARVPPVAALRDVAIERPSGSRSRVPVGVAVTVLGAIALAAGLVGPAGLPAVGVGAALVLLGVSVLGPMLARPVAGALGSPVARLRGPAGRLARANAVRNPRRTAATASALMIGVALVGFITILAASARASVDDVINRSFRSDLVVDSGMMSMGGLSPALATELARQPEVAQATGLRFAQGEINGHPQMLMAVNPADIGGISDLDVRQGSIADLDGTSIALSSKAAADAHLHVGATVTGRFVSGERALRVAAVYERQEVAGGYLIAHQLYESVVPAVLDMKVYVDLRPGVSAEAGRAAVERVTAGYPSAQVQDLTAFRDAQSRSIDQVLTLVYALLALAVVIALLGIGNTLALSVHERTRELGLLRAVGMTRAQVRATVRWESVIIALFGTVLGLGVGLFFGWAVVHALADQGIERLLVPLGQLLWITVLAGGAGVVAALLPARRAARLDVLDAIATA